MAHRVGRRKECGECLCANGGCECSAAMSPLDWSIFIPVRTRLSAGQPPNRCRWLAGSEPWGLKFVGVTERCIKGPAATRRAKRPCDRFLLGAASTPG